MSETEKSYMAHTHVITGSTPVPAITKVSSMSKNRTRQRENRRQKEKVQKSCGECKFRSRDMTDSPCKFCVDRDRFEPVP